MQLNNMTEKRVDDFMDDEISLAGIIAEFTLWVKLVKKNLLLFVVFGALGAAAGFAYAYFSKPTYNAKLSFVIKQSNLSSGVSTLSGLSSLFGAGTSTASNSIDRVIELAGSSSIVGKALLTQATIGAKSDLLANHFIKLNKLAESWQTDTVLATFKGFPIHAQYETLSYQERKALKSMQGQIAGSPENPDEAILSKNYSKESAIISLTSEFTNEEFAIALSRGIYAQLVNFYTLEATAGTSANVEVLKNKVDSIKNALYATQQTAAQKNDQALGLILQADKVDQKSLAIKENLLTMMYAEAQKNLETLSFMQYTAKPIFTVIDEPFSPIKPQNRSKKWYALLGILVPCTLLLFGLRMRKYFNREQV